MNWIISRILVVKFPQLIYTVYDKRRSTVLDCILRKWHALYLRHSDIQRKYSKPCDIAIAGFTIFSLNIAVPQKHFISACLYLYLFCISKIYLKNQAIYFDVVNGQWFRILGRKYSFGIIWKGANESTKSKSVPVYKFFFKGKVKRNDHRGHSFTIWHMTDYYWTCAIDFHIITICTH